MDLKGDKDARDRTYQYINAFSNHFKTQFGSLMCKELLGCDINTPEGNDYYEKNNFFETKCYQYVKKAAEIMKAELCTLWLVDGNKITIKTSYGITAGLRGT